MFLSTQTRGWRTALLLDCRAKASARGVCRGRHYVGPCSGVQGSDPSLPRSSRHRYLSAPRRCTRRGAHCAPLHVHLCSSPAFNLMFQAAFSITADLLFVLLSALDNICMLKSVYGVEFLRIRGFQGPLENLQPLEDPGSENRNEVVGCTLSLVEYY